MRVAPLLSLLLLVAACTRMIDVSGSDWQRAGAGIQQITFDEVECARDTVHAGDLPDTIVGGIVDAVVVPLEDARRVAAYDRCMRAKGYARIAEAR